MSGRYLWIPDFWAGAAVPETGKYNLTGFFVCDIIGSDFYLGEIAVYNGYKAAVEKNPASVEFIDG